MTYPGGVQITNAMRASTQMMGLTTILSQKSEHNHSLDERKVERHQLKVSAKRKATYDLSQRPSKIVRTYTVSSHLSDFNFLPVGFCI